MTTMDGWSVWSFATGRREWWIAGIWAGAMLFGGGAIPEEPPRPSVAAAANLWFAPTRAASAGWDVPLVEHRRLMVVDIDARDLHFLDAASGQTRRMPSAEIQAIEAEWANESAKQAHHAFANGDWAKVPVLVPPVIASGETPRWQQKLLAAEMCESLLAMGQIGNAGRVFVSLAKESLPPLMYAGLPLNWFHDRPDGRLIEQAQAWLKMENPEVAPLLGASWLLLSVHQEEARQRLERIAGERQPVLGALAASQLWRLATPQEVAENAGTWRKSRSTLLLPLQLGPTIILADKFERVGRKSEALQEWLWAKRLAPPAHPLASRIHQACLTLLKEQYPQADLEAWQRSNDLSNRP